MDEREKAENNLFKIEDIVPHKWLVITATGMTDEKNMVNPLIAGLKQVTKDKTIISVTPLQGMIPGGYQGDTCTVALIIETEPIDLD